MGLAELTDPRAIISAIQERDRLGREAFLAKHGYPTVPEPGEVLGEEWATH